MMDMKKLSTHGGGHKCGTEIGYVPMWRHSTQPGRLVDDWKRVPIEKAPNNPDPFRKGQPYPYFGGAILETAGVFGYAQAWALAWTHAAAAAEVGHSVELRMEKYSVAYEIEITKKETQ